MQRRHWLSHIIMQQVLLLPNVNRGLWSYCEVRSLPFNYPSVDLFAPLCTTNMPSYLDFLPGLKKSLTLEMEWLGKITPSSTKESGQSWSQNHASFTRTQNERRGIFMIMAMINKKVNTPKAQYHVMSVNKKLTAFLNSGHNPIGICD